ncbi:hypothetical protein [Xanthomonas campestris]|uniref:Uncharacterized protein n=1 Tax=Xanthomonas campestris pv. papavericola TaxID=487881 RepID=A0AAJ2X6L4_XANCA|nr:hypothetical protein [Xanthomonas campestris]MEC3890232.1 hypothetical protein [Xanthomonas campestris pv. papavericola]
MLIKNLTTPKKIDLNVTIFCKSLNKKAPVYLEVTPELWCRQQCCILNAKKFVTENGGSLVNGYKIWYQRGKYIEGERHTVVRTEDGQFRDITFNADGETLILFSADDDESMDYDDRPLKLRRGFTNAALKLVAQLNLQDKLIKQGTDEESWANMITYEEWLKGKRQGQYFAKYP